MNKKICLLLSCLLAVSALTGCGKVREVLSNVRNHESGTDTTEATETTEEQTETETETETETDAPFESYTGYINLPEGQEYTEMFSDTERSGVLERMYPADEVTVNAVDGEWAEVTCDGMTGYVLLEYISYSAPAPQQTEPEPTEKPTEAPTKAPTEAPTEASPEAQRSKIIAAYKTAIQSKISDVYSYGSGYVSIVFSLYDMDYDGTPELLVKYGTCEADYMIAIYTYRNGSLKKIADELGGGHTGFGYDYVANQIVLTTGHMGYGIMSWYDLDKNGELRWLIDTGEFEYGYDDMPEYEDFMKKYNVAWLDNCSFYGEYTTIVRYYGSDYTYEDYNGFDYRFLEEYPY